MKKNFLSFIASNAKKLAEYMNDDEALKYIYADYCYWFDYVQMTDEYNVENSIMVYLMDRHSVGFCFDGFVIQN